MTIFLNNEFVDDLIVYLGMSVWFRFWPTPMPALIDLGPVVQSIVSLTSLLRGQLVKCFMTSQPNTLIFFAEKKREAFALQKLLIFFQQKILAYLRY